MSEHQRALAWVSTWRLPMVARYVAAAAFGLTAAGCGGGSSTPGVAHISTTGSKSVSLNRSAASTAVDALAFTHCMRTHGVPEWPDPIDGHIGFMVHTPVAAIFGTPRVQAAYHRCVNGIFGPPQIAPVEAAKVLAAAVMYSHCMRSHGASDFPDPDRTGFITLNGSAYYYSPTVQRANQACKALRKQGVAIGWGVN
jgi:hypothetical protein